MQEERKNDAEILVIAERVDNLKAQLERSDEIAETWRKAFCVKLDTTNLKLDALIQKVSELPCPARIEQSKGIMKDIGWLQKIVYGIIITVVPSLLSIAVAWGALNKEVDHIKDNVKWRTATTSSDVITARIR